MKIYYSRIARKYRVTDCNGNIFFESVEIYDCRKFIYNLGA